MDFAHASVLITGGSEGIGLGLAARFLAAGAKVLVTGRSLSKLERAASELPGLSTFRSDISEPAQREALAKHVRDAMPALDVIVNNAGIQRRVSLAADSAEWSERQREIDTLLSGPVHLNHLLVPLLLQADVPGLIVNVTSGGAFVPQVFAPMYSACKAALHSYTVTLRRSLAKTNCRVVELIPPAVKTALADSAASSHGVPLDAFCDSVFASLVEGKANEIGYGPTAGIERLSRQELDAFFEKSAARFDVQCYERRAGAVAPPGQDSERS